jgi:hypothetical protein
MSYDHRQSRAVVKTRDLYVLEHIALEDRSSTDDILPPVAIQLPSVAW